MQNFILDEQDIAKLYNEVFNSFLENDVVLTNNKVCVTLGDGMVVVLHIKKVM